MKIQGAGLAVMTTTILAGCAGLDFGKQGLAYWEPKPYLFVNVDAECKSTATVVTVPGEKKYVHFKPGLGSADLSLALSNGILTNVGQKTDSKIPETIAAVSSLGTALSGGAKTAGEDNTSIKCAPTATLYAITDGVPDKNSTASYPVQLITTNRQLLR